ncbi:hypothetical protein ABN034_11235 [Actinopolymorpha sp. B11F2]|uniref:hypothetical protein n=1 Tax=Actinopolymorpha sp. B11F2 TaxID=3160862 RepID=UPI0032E45ECC
MRGRVPGRPALGAVIVLLLLLVVAGCAGTGGGSGDDTARVASADDGASDAGAADTGGASGEDGAGMSKEEREEKALKFAQCMRENGVPMDDPDSSGRVQIRVNGDDVDRETVEQAQQACQKYAPFGKEGPRQDPKMAENMRKFAQCMRDNGVPDFPDPDGGRMMLDKSIAGDPDFKAAQETCGEKFLPNRTGAPGGSQ